MKDVYLDGVVKPKMRVRCRYNLPAVETCRKFVALFDFRVNIVSHSPAIHDAISLWGFDGTSSCCKSGIQPKHISCSSSACRRRSLHLRPVALQICHVWRHLPNPSSQMWSIAYSTWHKHCVLFRNIYSSYHWRSLGQRTLSCSSYWASSTSLRPLILTRRLHQVCMVFRFHWANVGGSRNVSIVHY